MCAVRRSCQEARRHVPRMQRGRSDGRRAPTHCNRVLQLAISPIVPPIATMQLRSLHHAAPGAKQGLAAAPLGRAGARGTQIHPGERRGRAAVSWLLLPPHTQPPRPRLGRLARALRTRVATWASAADGGTVRRLKAQGGGAGWRCQLPPATPPLMAPPRHASQSFPTSRSPPPHAAPQVPVTAPQRKLARSRLPACRCPRPLSRAGSRPKPHRHLRAPDPNVGALILILKPCRGHRDTRRVPTKDQQERMEGGSNG